MFEKFQEILQKLSSSIELPLKVDKLNACTLKIEDKIKIQLKIDKTENFLIMIAMVVELPPGKFKENVFIQALKANAEIEKVGYFAFSEKNSNLVLFEYVNRDISDKLLKALFCQFIEKAIEWKEAINNNLSAPLNFLKETKIKPSPFDLK